MLDRLTRRRRPARPDLSTVAVFGAPFVVGIVGSRLTLPNLRGWYRSLDRPPWTPPDRVFGPVWTTLYLLMGIAGVRVWRANDRRTGAVDDPVMVALAIHAIQLQLNLAWSWLFFDRRRIDLALADIVALDAAVAATVVAFRRVRPDAAVLLLPYLAWSSFATALNAELLRRNGRRSRHGTAGRVVQRAAPAERPTRSLAVGMLAARRHP